MDLKQFIELSEKKIKWIKDNKDIKYDGESEDFVEGIIEGFTYCLNNLRKIKEVKQK